MRVRVHVCACVRVGAWACVCACVRVCSLWKKGFGAFLSTYVMPAPICTYFGKHLEMLQPCSCVNCAVVWVQLVWAGLHLRGPLLPLCVQ